MTVKKFLAAAGLAATALLLAACTQEAPEQVEPFQEIQVELDNGETASCIVYTTTDTDENDEFVSEVEEMSCNWPDK